MKFFFEKTQKLLFKIYDSDDKGASEDELGRAVCFLPCCISIYLLFPSRHLFLLLNSLLILPTFFFFFFFFFHAKETALNEIAGARGQRLPLEIQKGSGVLVVTLETVPDKNFDVRLVQINIQIVFVGSIFQTSLTPLASEFLDPTWTRRIFLEAQVRFLLKPLSSPLSFPSDLFS